MSTGLITKFDQLEAAIATLPPPEMELVHHFSEGVYCRELRMPKGTILTGKIHKKECINIVLGDITVYNLEDQSQERIIGYRTFKSPAGTRRAGVANEHTIWTTIHPTEETDLNKIEEQVIEPYVNPLLNGGRQIEH